MVTFHAHQLKRYKQDSSTTRNLLHWISSVVNVIRVLSTNLQELILFRLSSRQPLILQHLFTLSGITMIATDYRIAGNFWQALNLVKWPSIEMGEV
jgi:hypothetical protein